MNQTDFDTLLSYYLSQGAPQDQQMLIALLREVQTLDGNLLRPETLEKIARGCDVDVRLLNALAIRIPSLHPAHSPHRLQLCRTCQKARALAAFVEREYVVKNGGISQQGCFTFELVNCMKNCKAGPSLRWDGVLYPRADEALVKRLVNRCKTASSQTE